MDQDESGRTVPLCGRRKGCRCKYRKTKELDAQKAEE